MGQEKTQRENGRERRNEQQGRFVREGGPQGPPVVPLPAWSQGEESGPPATADLVGPALSQPEVLGPRAQLPGSHNPTTELQAKPPLDQGSLYAEL